MIFEDEDDDEEDDVKKSRLLKRGGRLGWRKRLMTNVVAWQSPVILTRTNNRKRGEF